MKGTRRSRALVSSRGQGSDDTLLGCRGLSKRFGSTIAVAGVDMDLGEGEILALTGESGSGKSTLLLCLAGILLPDAGEVRFRGRPLNAVSDGERTALRRTEFGFVFQLGHLVPDLSALMNVALPLMLNGASRPRAEAAARAWLGRFGVGSLGDRRPGEMSVGQAQRVAVARALVTRPSVVFADEPTGSLDSRNAEVVIEMLTRAAREQGSAVLLATHSATVAGVADRQLVMRDGMVAGAVR